MQQTLLFATSQSHCHAAPQLLVQSREGGFITKNCTMCGESRRVGFHELPSLSCDCGQMMEKKMMLKNYGYSCGHCSREFELWTRVPYWAHLFGYCGVATPNELQF